MTSRYGTLPFKWAIMALVLAALGAALIGTLLPAGAQDATIDYAEDRTDPVATFTGVDPEGRTVYWDLLDADEGNQDIDGDGFDDVAATDITDYGDFNISMDGVLTFTSPPSFESRNGGQLETAEETPATGSNTYKVVVVSSDDAPGATTDGGPPADDDSNLPKMAYHKVTVEVTDVDEDGTVSLSALQPQAGVALNVAGTADVDTDDAAATLKDQDASTAQINAAKWKWEQSSAMDGPWTLISGEASPSYTPATDVAGMYVRLTATYNDKHGDDKTAMETSAHPVRKAPAGGNSAPGFSAGATDTRKVKENSPSGTAVGKPVVAGDAGDVLTYTITGANQGGFSIDRATGQLKVGSRLNREGLEAPFEHTVTVRATDPYGDPDVPTRVEGNSAEIAVTITIENVNESPMVVEGPTRDKQEENEDGDPTTTDVIDIPILTYRVTDVDADDAIKWTVEGDDKGAFKVTPSTTDVDATPEPDDAATNGVTATLAFKKSSNYEKPIDADKDNVYMVTVVATDKKKLTATRDVVITVTNVNDLGTITFSSVQPKVGIPFMATLTDEDGVVGDVKWQWYNGNPDSDGDGDVDDIDTNAPIAKAKSDTYTPKTADLDADGPDGAGTGAVSLYVRATYTDSKGSTSAVGMADNLVVVNQENQPPEFKLNDKVITATTRMVAENTDADSEDDTSDTNDPADDIMAPGDDRTKDPVMATDISGTTPDTLTYTLGGRDAASFRVRSDTGQIEVGADTELDYETKKSYMVTVTATDPSLLSAAIDVTINVTDVNERPDIAGEDDITKEFRENSTSTIETFRATDPERRPVYWSLKADDTDYPDNEFFTISSSGALSFNEGRDYEAAADDETDNTYKVVVIASDDVPGAGITTARADLQATDPIMMSERKFTVELVNVGETGTVAVDRRYPQVAVPVLATLMDGDATADEISAATWQWYKGSTELSGNGAGTATYTPQPDDATTLRVEATYEAKGANRTANTTVSVRTVPSETNEDPEFAPGNDARTVQENRANTNVGAPITATDSNSADRGRLTYSLPDSETNFSINATSGQLKTTAGLNHEANASHDVVVTVTDPATSTSAVTVTVTVTVEDVNEAPMFGASATDLTSGPTRVLDWRENTTPITTHVATYPAFDPDEGAELVWSLTGPDANDFEISNESGTLGYLTFKESPDYEMPAASNNLYRVTVVVSDGKLKATRPMTVMVTDVEEVGMVTLSSVQPKVAIELTASLKDSDRGVENVTWQWERDGKGNPSSVCAEVDDADWAEIDGAESEVYTPVTSPITDVDKCLRAVAKYSDRRGDGKTSTMGVSGNPVIINTDNRPPEFKGQPGSLKVDENSADDADAPITRQIKADDPNDDKLTYKVTGAEAGLFKIANADDDTTADVDEEGQITVKSGTKLDYEAKSSYMVTVTATDPNGLMASHDVTIKITDVDEAPEITLGGLVITGKTSVGYHENDSVDVAAYTAAGPMKDAAQWSLEGDDAGDFAISGAGVLTFGSSPNYEAPADDDTDNVYMVTVKANDGENMATRDVTVTVINVDEDGAVTLSTQMPQVGEALIATLNDPDGGVTGESWQWARSMSATGAFTDIDGATSDSYTPVTGGDDGYYLMAKAAYDDDEGSGKAAEATTNMAVTSNHPPAFGTAATSRDVPENTAAGMDIGAPVEATDADDDTLTYTLSGDDMADFDIAAATGQIMTKAALDFETKDSYTVTVTASDGTDEDTIMVTIMVTDVDENVAPEFAAATDTRSVAENTAAGENIGAPVTATDADDDTLTYTLGGDDMASFAIDTATGQLMTSADLDFETKASYSVTVTASDGTEEAAITVAIMVTDVDGEEVGPMTLLDRYDADDSGDIDKNEAIRAINDYLFGEGADAITKDQAIGVINLYLFG